MHLNVFESSGSGLSAARPRQGKIGALACLYRGRQPSALGHNVIPLWPSLISKHDRPLRPVFVM